MHFPKVLIALAFALVGCDEVMTQPSVAPTEAVTPAQTAAAVAVIPRDQRAMARAFVSVVDRLEPVAEQECRRRAPLLNCDFLIVVDDRPDQPPNAFQTLDDDGRPVVAFTIALIAEAQNVDEIAFIMAHEAAHHIENHLAQQQRNASIAAQSFGELANLTGRDADGVRIAQELGAAVGARSFSQEFELEADRLGTIITARAGYDPLVGSEFFFRAPDPGDTFLATHPPNAQRLEMVRRTAAGL